MKDQLVEIRIPNLREIERRLGDLRSKAPQVMAMAINRTIPHVSKIMVKEAQAGYIVKAGAAKKTLRLRKASKSDISGEVISKSSEKIRLIGFKASPANPRQASPPRAYKAQAVRAGSLKSLSGSDDRSAAFVAKMQSGHKGIFQRQLGRGNGRLPIAELYGLAIPSMFKAKRLSEPVIRDGESFLRKTLDTTVKYMLGG